MSGGKRKKRQRKVPAISVLGSMSWNDLAFLAARCLNHLPDKPKYVRWQSTQGLLTQSEMVIDDSPDPERDRWLHTLTNISALIRRHADSQKPDPETPDGKALIDSLAHLSLVLEARCAPQFAKTGLPILIAAITRTVSTAASIRAKYPRPRTIKLRDAKFKVQAANPRLTWKELLAELEGEDIVTDWNDSRIEWIELTKEGEAIPRECATSTFRGWKQQPK